MCSPSFIAHAHAKCSAYCSCEYIADLRDNTQRRHGRHKTHIKKDHHRAEGPDVLRQPAAKPGGPDDGRLRDESSFIDVLCSHAIAPSVGVGRFARLSNEYPIIRYPCDIYGFLDSLCCDSYSYIGKLVACCEF